MKSREHATRTGTRARRQGGTGTTACRIGAAITGATVAKAFSKIGPRLRVEVLNRLLSATGPLALAVIGGGMFAKYIGRARWPEVAVSPEDAARITSRQILDLARYVEQSDPPMLRKVVALLSTDIAAMTVLALGGSAGDCRMVRPAERQPLLLPRCAPHYGRANVTVASKRSGRATGALRRLPPVAVAVLDPRLLLADHPREHAVGRTLGERLCEELHLVGRTGGRWRRRGGDHDRCRRRFRPHVGCRSSDRSRSRA